VCGRLAWRALLLFVFLCCVMVWLVCVVVGGFELGALIFGVFARGFCYM
jgi:hypothetical protein